MANAGRNRRYSGSAVSTYREDQFNANVDKKDSLAVKFFFLNNPRIIQFAVKLNF